MQLSLQTFTSLVQTSAAAVQGACSQLIDLTVGSVLRAVLEANASIALWIQWLILQVLALTRAATSSGRDLDTWMADFSLNRLPASPASGNVMLARFTPTSSALIPVGAIVKTGDGTQSYAVSASPSNSAWSATQNGYVLAAGVASVSVPVTAQAAGSAGNVLTGAVSLLSTAIPGVDTVSNGAAFQGGLDAESDAAFRARFVNYMTSLSRATKTAVGYAVTGIQQGLTYTIQENVDSSGAMRMGSFIVTVDDGTGSPPASLLQTISASVDAVRPVGSIFAVQPPAVMIANVSLTITVAPGVNKLQTAGLVAAAITSYANALQIGALLPWSRLAQIAYDASSQVTNVSDVILNGGSSDLIPAPSGVVMAGLVAVN